MRDHRLLFPRSEYLEQRPRQDARNKTKTSTITLYKRLQALIMKTICLDVWLWISTIEKYTTWLPILCHARMSSLVSLWKAQLTELCHQMLDRKVRFDERLGCKLLC